MEGAVAAAQAVEGIGTAVSGAAEVAASAAEISTAATTAIETGGAAAEQLSQTGAVVEQVVSDIQGADIVAGLADTAASNSSPDAATQSIQSLIGQFEQNPTEQVADILAKAETEGQLRWEDGKPTIANATPLPEQVTNNQSSENEQTTDQRQKEELDQDNTVKDTEESPESNDSDEPETPEEQLLEASQEADKLKQEGKEQMLKRLKELYMQRAALLGERSALEALPESPEKNLAIEDNNVKLKPIETEIKQLETSLGIKSKTSLKKLLLVLVAAAGAGIIMKGYQNR